MNKEEALNKMIEVNVQPKPLNLFQKAIKNSKEPLKDGVTYKATLIRVEDYETKKGIPVLSYVYDVNGVEASDNYFFSQISMQKSMNRLIETLEKFNFELNVQQAVDGLETIRYFTEALIGSVVEIVQETRTEGNKSYSNCYVVAVKKIENRDSRN